MNLDWRATASRPTGAAELDAVAAAEATLSAALASAPQVDLDAISPPLLRGSWSLWPEALRFLVSLVRELRPGHILEFGSGVSTCALAWAGADAQPLCRITSVDNDPEFSRRASEAVDTQERRCRVSFEVAPLVIREWGGRDVPVYLLARKVARRGPVDLVVIDGPPVALGGREGTLYQALELARPGTIAVLDDADRPEEQETLAQWRAALGSAIDVHVPSGFPGGLAAVIVRKPIGREEIWEHKVRLAREQIEALVPADVTFIVADGNTWGQEFWKSDVAAERQPIPFLERGGEYWGAPPDDVTAVKELERMLATHSPRYVVWGWPTFWWLEDYPALRRYLNGFSCVARDERLIVYEVQ